MITAINRADNKAKSNVNFKAGFASVRNIPYYLHEVLTHEVVSAFGEGGKSASQALAKHLQISEPTLQKAYASVDVSHLNEEFNRARNVVHGGRNDLRGEVGDFFVSTGFANGDGSCKFNRDILLTPGDTPIDTDFTTQSTFLRVAGNNPRLEDLHGNVVDVTGEHPNLRLTADVAILEDGTIYDVQHSGSLILANANTLGNATTEGGMHVIGKCNIGRDLNADTLTMHKATGKYKAADITVQNNAFVRMCMDLFGTFKAKENFRTENPITILTKSFHVDGDLKAVNFADVNGNIYVGKNFEVPGGHINVQDNLTRLDVGNLYARKLRYPNGAIITARGGIYAETPRKPNPVIAGLQRLFSQ